MILHQAVRDYTIYLKALRLPDQHWNVYRDALKDIMLFYGRNTPLSAFNEAKVLEYARDYDPFDSTPEIQERGQIFCMFIDWLMRNELIPAWADMAHEMDSWAIDSENEMLDNWEAA